MNLYLKPLGPKLEVIQDVNFIPHSPITKKRMVVSDFKYLQKTSKFKVQYNPGKL